MVRIADISWAHKLLAVSCIYILGLMSVGVVGSYTIYTDSKTTDAALRASQTRAHAASSAQVAILVMGRAQAQLLSAADADDRRNAAIAAIGASSSLDESIQRLQEALSGNAKVAELSQHLQELGPQKMQVIRAVRTNDDATARATVASMQAGMARVEDLAEQLTQEEEAHLAAVVADRKKRGKSTIGVLGAMVAAGMAASLLVSWFAGRLMAGPLGTLEQSARSLATGDLTIKVPQFGGDEIGRTATAMGSMVQDLHTLVTNIHHNGRTVTIQAAGVAAAANRLQGIFAQLHEAVGRIEAHAATVLSSTNTTIEQLKAAADTAQGTSQSAARNSTEIKATADGFQRFQQQMEQTVEFSRELMKKVAAIRTIAGTIDDISSQAHLLALNAAIEAARAGEHGRGFAVVADEVGKLAHRSLSATAEISALTEAIASSTAETVQLLEDTMTQAHENISRLLLAAAETANSSQQTQQMQNTIKGMVSLIGQQGQAVTDINGAVGGLSELSQSSMDQTESLHVLSGELNNAATGLNRVVERFRLQPLNRAQLVRRKP